MSLFPKWTGKIQLPPTPETRKQIGGNFVVQKLFPGALVAAEISDSQYQGHDLVFTELSPPFDQLLLRRSKAHKINTPLPVLVPVELPEGPQALSVQWESLGDIANFADSPNKVLDTWLNKFIFVTEDEDRGLPGLRRPQIGALHAIAAHFAVGREFEAATIVLPTGTGKTETMLATAVYRRLSKILVIVPSAPLRAQIGRKFETLGVLPDAKAVPLEIARPFVCRIGRGLKTADEAQALVGAANVLIATPDIIAASNPEARAAMLAACTDLIVDEAHHITARTWRSIKDAFAGKRIIQFTATPFRRDEEKVDGKIIFNFKLGDAQEADYYRPINLRTIEEFGDQATKDLKVAHAAIEVLRHDRNNLKLDHIMMARTRSKERANDLLAIYSRLAPELNPVQVYSGPGRAAANRAAMSKLFDRGPAGARIAICVDMLGEGFDLPNLKVAALHDTHKSLAVTLQFVGRFTRKGARGEIGEATVVTNIAEPEAEKKLANLYAEGADWDRIIRRLSEQRIEQELKLQDLVDRLKKKGSLHSQLSLWNLKPALSTQIFRTTCKSWYPESYRNILPKGTESWYALSEDDNVLVAVIHREVRVKWGNYQNLEETTYQLLIALWDKSLGALFIHASDADGLRTEKLADELTGKAASLVNGEQIFQILNNVELPLAKSLGSSRVGAISFTSYFGPNVTEGLANIEKREAELNNIACLGYEDGERVLWGGAKKKGKVWQQTSATVSEWVDWCRRTWEKVSSADAGTPNITRDFLRPIRMKAPHGSHPVAVQWGEHAQMGPSERQFVLFGATKIPLYLVEVGVGAIADDGSTIIRIGNEDHTSEYRITISEEFPEGYSYQKVAGGDVSIERANGDVFPLPEFLRIDPFIVRYADGTHSYNCYHIPVRLDAGTYQLESVEAWDWSGVKLNRESMGKQRTQNTVQYHTFEMMRDEYDLIFNDDGSGEAADLVALREVDEFTIRLCLVHCKNALGGTVSSNIENFYTLCGQVQKSASVKHRGIARLYQDLKRRHEIWQRTGASRFLKGDLKQLAYFKEKARRAKLEFEVVIVQPGASKATLTNDIRSLLATTELYLKKTAAADLRVVVSAREKYT